MADYYDLNDPGSCIDPEPRPFKYDVLDLVNFIVSMGFCTMSIAMLFVISDHDLYLCANSFSASYPMLAVFTEIVIGILYIFLNDIQKATWAFLPFRDMLRKGIMISYIIINIEQVFFASKSLKILIDCNGDIYPITYYCMIIVRIILMLIFGAIIHYS